MGQGNGQRKSMLVQYQMSVIVVTCRFHHKLSMLATRKTYTASFDIWRHFHCQTLGQQGLLTTLATDALRLHSHLVIMKDLLRNGYIFLGALSHIRC